MAEDGTVRVDGGDGGYAERMKSFFTGIEATENRRRCLIYVYINGSAISLAFQSFLQRLSCHILADHLRETFHGPDF